MRKLDKSGPCVRRRTIVVQQMLENVMRIHSERERIERENAVLRERIAALVRAILDCL